MSRLFTGWLMAWLAAMPVLAAVGPESDPSNVYWDDQFTLPGTDAPILVTVKDSSGNIYIGGNFQAVGNSPVSYIAKWNGTAWSALGSGVSGVVRALAADGTGNVYVGGDFTTAGGSAAAYIAKWDGSTWSSLGAGMSGSVYALLWDGSSNLYAGGTFTTAGSVTVNRIAKWNGTTWSALGATAGTSGPVNALAFKSPNLYACGLFATAGGVTVNNVAQWNGTAWSALGATAGTSGTVNALAVDGSGNLYAGGLFATAGGVTVNNVATWSGGSWSALGATAGTNGAVNALAVDSSGNLYAGGAFAAAGGMTVNDVAKWSGGAWSALGAGMNGTQVNALAFDASGNLCVAGQFIEAGGVCALDIAKWTVASSTWSGVVGAGITGINGATIGVQAIVKDSSGNYYIGGNFTTVAGVAAKNVAKWTGTAWSPLGTGMDNTVYALVLDGSGNLYAGGSFVTAGGTTVNHVAKWNGTAWSALGPSPNVGTTGGTGFVRALAYYGGNVYVGGNFTTAGTVLVNYIAQWDGANWAALGTTGVNSVVRALTVDGSGNLYAGGQFSTAGGVSVNNVAKWSGGAWSALGATPGTTGPVYALACDASANLYAGGTFTAAGGVSATNVAKWDSAAWSALGTGLAGTYVFSLVFDGSGNLNAGGGFVTAGGVTVNNVAQWNGTAWSAFGSGVTGGSLMSGGVTTPYVYALLPDRNELLVGGVFGLAGGKVSGYFASWQPRVNMDTASLPGSPGALTVGNDLFGFYKPALQTAAGTTVKYGGSGGLPVTVTMNRADEIQVNNKRVNEAASLAPTGVQFGGDGATLRVEFSDDDVASFGAPYTSFLACSLSYPAGYPLSKQAAVLTPLSLNIPAPFRTENGKQIYSVSMPFAATDSTLAYGAVPQSLLLPAAPSNPGSANIGLNTIQWTWTDNSNNETGFRVYFDKGVGPPLSTFGLLAAATTVYERDSLDVNAEYAFQVAATNLAGDSAKTANYTVWTQIEPVAGLAFPSVGLTSISVAASNTPSNLTSGLSGLSFVNRTELVYSALQHDNTPWTSSGLLPNAPYEFGAESQNGAAVITAMMKSTKYTLIEPVSSLAFSGVSTSSISVASTNTPSNLSSGSSGLYFANTTSGTNSGWQSSNAPWTSGALSPNTPYAFTGNSRNGEGVTNIAATETKYTLATTPTAPLVGSPGVHTLSLAIGYGDGNPATTAYAIHLSPAVGGNSWVQANGSVGASAVYQTAASWSFKTVTGLAEYTSYSITVTASNGEGVLTAPGPAGTGITSDGTPPTVQISAPSAAVTQNGPVTFTVSYADTGSGVAGITLGIGDITLNKAGTGGTGTANAVVSSVSGTGLASRTVTISGITGDGALGISIAANTASDLAGNNALAAGPSATFIVDNTPPTVQISAPSASVTQGGPVTFVITYADTGGSGIAGITLGTGDIALDKSGTANGVVSVSGTGLASRTVTISGITGDGALGISIAANTASDLAGNKAPAAGPGATFTVDNTPPTVEISAPSVSWTQGGLVTFTVSYMDTGGSGVAGITLGIGDITLNKTGTVNGVVSNVSGTGLVPRTVTISGITGDGTLGLSIAPLTATDVAGNFAAAAGPSTTVGVDNTPPTGTITINGGATYTTATSVTLGLSANDGMGSGVAKVQFSNDQATWSGNWQDYEATKAWTLANSEGLRTVYAQYKDAAGNVSTGSGGTGTIRSAITLDSKPPTVAISAPLVSLTRGGPVTYTVSYADTGSGVDDITLATGNITLNRTGTANGVVDVSGTGLAPRTVTISGITGDGALGISIAANTASDLAGNQAPAAGPSGTFVVDNTPPTGSIIINDGAAYTNSSSALLTLSATDGVGSGVTGMQFSNDNVTWSGGWQDYKASKAWTLSNSDGLKTVYVQYKDAAGNVSAGTISGTITLDTVPPTTRITLDNPTPTSADSVAFNVAFSERLSAPLALSQISLRSGSLAGNIALTGAAPNYTITVMLALPDADGTVGIVVAAGGLTDLAGNAYAGDVSPLYTIHNWHGLTTQPTNTNLYPGDSHTFAVDGDFGPIAPVFQWEWNDGALVQGGPETASWPINNATVANAGTYWCEVIYDGILHESAVATLSVENHLAITTPPANATAATHQAHTFTVATTGGFSPLTYIWKKNGAPIPGATGPAYTIPSLAITDAGTYTVEVSDANTDSETASAQLTVIQGAPIGGVAGMALLLGFMAIGGILKTRKK